MWLNFPGVVPINRYNPMRSRHYTNEIGVNAAERPVPTLVSVVILALVVIVAAVLVRQIVTSNGEHKSVAEQTSPPKVASR